jgi:polyisoprenoid-binding protein YceI
MENKMESINKSNEETLVQEKTWTVDKAHTKLQFSARHMIIAEVVGLFKSYDLKIENGKDDFNDSKIDLTIDTKSIDSGVPDRDNHLRSADFFNVEKYPVMTFKSKSFTKIDDEKYKLKGDLTIKNVTREIDLDVTFGGQIIDPWGKQRVGFKIIGSINRFDYDLKWNALIETGGAVVSKNVNIICDVELAR